MSAEARIQIETAGRATVVRFVECRVLDDAAVYEFKNDIKRLLEERADAHLVISLAGVEYLTSSMLGTLLMLNGRLGAVGGRLVLCDSGPGVQDIFRVARINPLLEIKANEQEAVAEIVGG